MYSTLNNSYIYAKLIAKFHFFFINQSDLNITASFDRRGQYIYTGNGKGRILVLDANSLEVSYIAKNSKVQHINSIINEIV